MAETKLVLGNEAIGRGLVESGCQVMAAYPGTPSSEILPSVIHYKSVHGLNTYVEWSVNEKVAFEVALAAAMTGKRAAVAMKQVGLNVAADPLMSSAYTGVVGGLLVISCDDPGPESSQTEQDTRLLAMTAKVPVLDPSNIDEAKGFVGVGFEISERYQVPVILRPTTKVCYMKGSMELGPIRETGRKSRFQKDPQRWAATPRYRFLLHKNLNAKLKKVAEEFSQPGKINFVTPGEHSHAPLGIIASGVAYSVVMDLLEEHGLTGQVPVLKLGMPFPFPAKLVQGFLSRVETTLILEEPGAFIELQIADRRNVLGRLSEHVPSEGELSPEVMAGVLTPLLSKAGLVRKPAAPDTTIGQAIREMGLPGKPPRLCPGCPHTASFLAIRKALPDAIFTSDIGCYTLGLNLGAVDTVLVMGAGINLATGFYHSYKQDGVQVPIVATIGDSTFFHAGLPGLVNAVHTGARFILVVLDNSVVAMTGQQPPPHSDVLADGRGGTPVTIRGLLEASGVRFVKQINPYEVGDFIRIVREAYEFTRREDGGLAAIIAVAPCVIYDPHVSRDRNPITEVTGVCTGCKVCLEAFDCPSLLWNAKTKKVEIDPKTCVGCGICVYVCPQNELGPSPWDLPQDYFLENDFLLDRSVSFGREYQPPMAAPK